MEPINRYKEIFWDAFHRPKLNSSRMHELWDSLEPLNDLIAGPLFNIYETGNCNYVFSDNHLFANVKTKDDLLDWLTERIEKYREPFTKIKAEDEIESEDLQVILFQTDLKMELAELAYKII